MAGKPRSVTAEERFWANVQKTETCWLWTGYIKPNGYASFYPGGGRGRGKVYAHRFAYELFKGPIPDGLETDHLCHVRHCVNPAHLEAVTHRVNLDRRNARKTHCHRGHEYTDENTYRYGKNNRRCRTCATENERRYRSRISLEPERISIVRGV